ncbi:aminotransferase class I/II-fold pyridoxal phosphate-dependent enzyme [Paenibacillus sp. JX-17]|uniref:Aminotransferase class I/II-fold pyridoxal phosphate-dependent enzyme n=1 Tax=Paenibacillus lacisoli TaxID=3064525 RepID=A0ABT9CLR6_9BACL|nr:aminotransferase class I/II-fold pyridoxal phosphate-dependent enzyme [Paenibacillus sp. JX-17]MDO7908548.1 aminotransferase class I/II-fold pyridoxal phosphate-dependent enzyme [Paenibacillus sp. JX-17]
MTLEKTSAPLYEALLHYREGKKKSFHVPGHKNGQVYADTQEAELLRDVMMIDATEITGLDDLHHPEGAIEKAQTLAADCFGAAESFLLVGGSTAGNLAMILSVCTEPGDILLVQRNVHKSVVHGLMLSGAQAVFLTPHVDEYSGLPVAPLTTTIAAALSAYPNAKGVLLTMPNYYGMGSDLTPAAELCHQYGVPLLVDEAHGAHYGLHAGLPASALSCGADGVVQSTHKMLPAMTMGAMLHVQGDYLDRTLIRQRLAMLQSSSPSYPLMASLDLARRHVHVLGAEAFEEGLRAVEAMKEGLKQLPRFGFIEPSPSDGQRGYTSQDPFKISVYDREDVWSGYELQNQLEQAGCVPEMSDDRYVVLLFTLGSKMEDTIHLLQALTHIHAQMVKARVFTEESKTVEEETGQAPNLIFSTWNNTSVSNYSLPVRFSIQPQNAAYIEAIPVEQAAGRISAEMVIPYPPGIPILYAGEKISAGMVAQLLRLSHHRVKCQGCADASLHTVRVMQQQI